MKKKRGRPSELVLFVDVNFWDDPKIVALTEREQIQWLRTLAEQLKTRNGSKLPFGHWGLSRVTIGKLLSLGLLVDIEGELHVNNWDSWNGRDAYKRFLARQRKRRQRGREQGAE